MPAYKGSAIPVVILSALAPCYLLSVRVAFLPTHTNPYLCGYICNHGENYLTSRHKMQHKGVHNMNFIILWSNMYIFFLLKVFSFFLSSFSLFALKQIINLYKYRYLLMIDTITNYYLSDGKNIIYYKSVILRSILNFFKNKISKVNVEL